MIQTDFLVIGSGIAGLSFAIKASKFGRVAIVTKEGIKDSNTSFAQGGLAAVFSKDDSFEMHIKDTLRAGDGLCNKKAVEVLVKNAKKEIKWLIGQGVKFDFDNSHLALSKEAVHSMARIVHSGDITGKRVEDALAERILNNDKIKVYENHIAFELIKDKKDCIGARALDTKKQKIVDFFSCNTIIATGGIGRIYKKNTNPKTATGEGIAAAFLLGAEVQDMEFMQFHPTLLYNSNPAFLISETLRGEGGLLKNRFGQTYMEKYHRDGVLAPRDVVSKFTVEEMKKTKSRFVYLDVRHLGSEYLRKRFPTIADECMKYKIDITKQMIPVVPAAHYICGGIKTDLNGKTNIKNLYAIGECACTGLHGADRLASNSLVEGLVFSTRLADFIKKNGKAIKTKKLREVKIERFSKKNMEKYLQSVMWDYVGITRNIRGLSYALREIKKMHDKLEKRGISRELIEIKGMLIVAGLIAKSALMRKESRGTHFIDEYPRRDDKNWSKHIILHNRKY